MLGFCASGGGEKFVYQAGVAVAGLECGRPWRKLYGTSAGGLISLLVWLGYGPDDIRRLVLDEWRTPDIWKRWWFGYLEGVFRGALWDSRPLWKTVQGFATPNAIAAGKASGLELGMGCVDLHTMKHVVASADSVPLHLWAAGTSAHPLALIAPTIDGHQITDGGVRHVTPLRSMIRSGGIEEVDLCLTFPKKGDAPLWKPNWWQRFFKLLGRTLREVQILLDEASADDLKMTELVNCAVAAGAPEMDGKKRIKLNVIRPKKRIEMTTLQLIPSEVEPVFEMGYEDGMEVFEPLKTA